MPWPSSFGWRWLAAPVRSVPTAARGNPASTPSRRAAAGRAHSRAPPARRELCRGRRRVPWRRTRSVPGRPAPVLRLAFPRGRQRHPLGAGPTGKMLAPGTWASRARGARGTMPCPGGRRGWRGNPRPHLCVIFGSRVQNGTMTKVAGFSDARHSGRTRQSYAPVKSHGRVPCGGHGPRAGSTKPRRGVFCGWRKSGSRHQARRHLSP